MRCINKFLCQFGIAGIPSYNKPYNGKNQLKDDPNWLPEGPTHRTNELGVKRFGKGSLDKIYTGYGEDGPSQGRLSREGSSEGVAKDFPKLDYILSCDVIDTI